ncbi:MAG: hypothetical protein KHW47_02560 [Actinotignum schaalii]|nr:hypothetical protein [Actinotignum schaalii]
MEYANVAAGIATQTLGAIPSMPTAADVAELLDELDQLNSCAETKVA